MPAVIPNNLHSGFLNEEYGLLLLRQLTAVAPVGRPEDHGIDAIATLLPKSGQTLVAAETFLIQFKSSSIRTIPYGEPGKGNTEVKWLRSLQVPLFFGAVSRMEGGAPGKLRIYSSQCLMGPLLLHPEFSCIEVCFDAADELPTREQERTDLARLEVEAHVRFANQQERSTWIEGQYHAILSAVPRTAWWLDQPILEFDLKESANDARREHLIGVMRKWVQIGYENIGQAPIGMFTFLNWTTNELPVVSKKQMSPREPSPGQVDRIMRAVAHPGVTYLLERIYHGTRGDIDAIFAVLDGMSRDGADISLQREFIEENWERLRIRRESYRQERNLSPN